MELSENDSVWRMIEFAGSAERHILSMMAVMSSFVWGIVVWGSFLLHSEAPLRTLLHGERGRHGKEWLSLSLMGLPRSGQQQSPNFSDRKLWSAVIDPSTPRLTSNKRAMDVESLESVSSSIRSTSSQRRLIKQAKFPFFSLHTLQAGNNIDSHPLREFDLIEEV